MRRLIMAYSLAIGIGAPLAASADVVTTLAPVSPPAAAVTATPSTPASQKLQMNARRLEIEIQILQSEGRDAEAYRVAEIAHLPTGG